MLCCVQKPLAWPKRRTVLPIKGSANYFINNVIYVVTTSGFFDRVNQQSSPLEKHKVNAEIKA